ncbi:MAG: hypothetical protein JNK85_16805 [Verrucomicrobiales bacterium]|nr:hypothetical protein [Verrucomicrobiales bacterium]
MHRLSRFSWFAVSLIGLASVAPIARAQSLTLPLEIRQPNTIWNLQSVRGVPISSVVNQPPGSDGRMTNRNESGSALLPTTNQFRGFVSFGGVPGLTSNQWISVSNSPILKAGNGAFSGNLAAEMRLPLARSNDAVILVFRQTQVGSPFLSRQVSFPFGSIVSAPTTDENGLPLTVPSSTYWLPEPYTTNRHTNAPYYWSPHSQKVYAIQAGPMSIRWIKAAYSQTQPPDFASNPGNYFVNGGNYFRLYSVNYVVSGTPVKPPRRMYWTEREFGLLGKPVAVPTARVGAVHIVYNNNFPKTVSQSYSGPGQTSPTDGSTNQVLQELRTIWYDQQLGSIYAYNQEGRVFLELLGDVRADGQTREQLGFEIVDVTKQPSPLDVRVELGDRILPPAPGTTDTLSAEPVQQVGGSTFAYIHSVEGKDETTLYAARETTHLNDYFIHWMETGLVGLKWPSLLGRYELVWPTDIARYSHYVRPLVDTESEARRTAVPLPTANAPVIEYQDPLDQPRGKLTETYGYYTYLSPAQPLHRALIRYNAGDQVAFERVFSWLDVTLKSGIYDADSIATTLDGWSSATRTLQFSNALTAPRVVDQTVEVGQRILPPPDESNAYGDELAGHIKVEEGDLFHATAYADPFVAGFDTAQLGSIIPVNSIPGNDHLEIWWFRPNAAQTTAGFETIRWPSVIGRYQVRWPIGPREIILASNAGSGVLPSLVAKGEIYFQNDRNRPGFNPNEEHALMLGGQAWALRDDLNVVTGTDATSEPYVLVSYIAEDGRPSVEPFKVLREKGTVSFNYPVVAGSILQAPMPLPLLPKPLGPKVVGTEPRSLNQEQYFRTVASSTALGGAAAEIRTVETHHFRPWHRELALQSPNLQSTKWFFATNTPIPGQSLRGLVSDSRGTSVSSASLLPVVSNLVETGSSPFIDFFGLEHTRRTYRLTVRQPIRYTVPSALPLAVGQKVYVIAPSLNAAWEWSAASVNPTSLDVEYLYVEDFETTDEVLTFTSSKISGNIATFLQGLTNLDELRQASTIFVPSGTVAANQYAGWRLRAEPIPASGSTGHGAFTLQDRKGDLWVVRGPHDGSASPYLQMQFYYNTLPGFFFPSLSLADQPPAGTITPFLRTRDPSGLYLGDPVYGNRSNPVEGDNNAMMVVYRPVWPTSTPVLQMAETLTLPKRGLPAIRGQSSLEVVYQQSQAADPNRVSVRLHDPTREKEFELAAPNNLAALDRIPDSVKTETARGLTYFPLLPPHLSERFFLDPNRGKYGKLVFRGEFRDETVGDDVLHLNVLSPKDAATLQDLCLASDPARSRWNDAIAALSTAMVKYVESPQKPGTYVPAEGPAIAGPGDLAAVTDDDVAVDSYALSAVGPGQGYVTLVAGNGLAFTPREDPVSVHVLRVTNVLYAGEVKAIAPENPLSEKLTLQQVVDLAGGVKDFEFQWKIASPVDGLPPQVFQTTRRLLLGNGTWQHLTFPATAQDGVRTNIYIGMPRTIPVNLPGQGVVAVSSIPFSSYTSNGATYELQTPGPHMLPPGTWVVASAEVSNGTTLSSVELLGQTLYGPASDRLKVLFSRGAFTLRGLREAIPAEFDAQLSQSTLYREFTVPAATYSQLWLSLDIDDFLAARIYVNGEPVITVNFASGNTAIGTPPAGILPLPKAYSIDPSILNRGQVDGVQRIAVQFYSDATSGTPQRFNLQLEGLEAVDQTGLAGSPWLNLESSKYPDGLRTIIGESADVRALSDNYFIMRYRATNTTHASFGTGWSRWTTPQLAEGWIKRALAGLNPFNQRLTDLFNNRVNTDVSLLTSAGTRWEGEVALNLESINQYGLIEIYETILRRGRMLSIDGGINYGPANDALLLAAGYLNDLYMIVGNEAWADASNPTIGIGTADRTYGDIATSLIAFKGQVASLLDEELALLRGRDDFLQPGVDRSPVYNRLVWNYTRGIDAGEVVYAVNYNIQENPDQTPDGVINADDAARLFPQGHGDAYGHYLTALKGYYALLLNNKFDWVPRIEAVTVLGQPVSVDYQDERKFAAAAAAVSRVGRQIFDLTWRKDGSPGQDKGWTQFSPTRVNTRRTLPSTQYWGLDHWASRIGQGQYLHWIIGNSILPAVDPDPAHQGIQKVDRTTVPELTELATMGRDLQQALDNADSGLTPLGLSGGSLALDLNPNAIVGADDGTHFEQIYGRAKAALNNAVAAFDDAKDVTRLMRSEQDSLAEVQAGVARQELAYQNALIDLYGTPYPEDIGPDGTYNQGYSGPDLIHFAYAETPQLTFPGLLTNTEPRQFRIDIQGFSPAYEASDKKTTFDFVRQAVANDTNSYRPNLDYVEFTLDSSGSFVKPSTWTGRRTAPGRIQEAISRIHLARAAALGTLASHETLKRKLDRSLQTFQQDEAAYHHLHHLDLTKASIQAGLESAVFVTKMAHLALETWGSLLEDATRTALESIPRSTIAGTAFGGDVTSPARGAVLAAYASAKSAKGPINYLKEFTTGAFTVATQNTLRFRDVEEVQPLLRDLERQAAVLELDNLLGELQGTLHTINQRLEELDAAVNHYRSLLAQGDRLQAEREVYRQHTAAVIQGYRTRDAAFRFFRNEKLERYKALFDLASRYAFLAANAYDYETGLLDSSAGASFVQRILSARALGVVRNAEPQYAGSNTGDPGLSSALAEMKADWDVLKGRLGFNRPDAYGTTLSLRTELFRILASTNSDAQWMDALAQGRLPNVLADEDVRRHCLQIGANQNLPVPGLVLAFSTTIGQGVNVFGRDLAAGDHAFSSSAFATKIFGVGVALEGYRGMDKPAANAGAGGASPPDPDGWFTDPLGLAATPEVYLIPVGVDSMRRAPIDGTSSLRSWTVEDVAIPLPFNISGTDLNGSRFQLSANSLSEPLFAPRQHQAFRPVPSADFFEPNLYGAAGTLQRSQYTNNRLVGRSAWNSRWKLVIPGHSLLRDPDEGLNRLLRTVRDIKLHFVTYSYSGN